MRSPSRLVATAADTLIEEVTATLRDLWVLVRRDRAAALVGLVFVALTLVGIGLHALGADAPKGTFERRWLHIGRDNSLQEFYGYALALVAAGGLVVCWRRTGVATYLVGGLALAFVAADDAFGYHEETAGLLKRRFDLPVLPKLAEGNTGELLAWGAAGLLFAALFVLAALQRSGITIRVLTVLAGMIGALAVFAVGVDLVHHITYWDAVTYLEDGGELMALALSAWVAVALARNPWPARHAPSPAGRAVPSRARPGGRRMARLP